MSAEKSILTLKETNLTLASIKQAVKSTLGIPEREFSSPHRGPGYAVRGRLIYYWLARKYTNKSFPQIAKSCSRDHSTVLMGSDRVEANLPKFQPLINAVLERLEAA